MTDIYAIETIDLYLYLARKAFRDRPDLSSVGFEVISTIPENYLDVEGYIAVKGETVVVAFRPTEAPDRSFRDWLNNFFYFKKVIPYNNMRKQFKAHGGYVSAYTQEEVRDFIHVELNRIIVDYGIKEIITTGHSQGGALCQLCAEDIWFDFRDLVKVRCLSFASPRVFSYEGARIFKERVPDTLLVQNACDAVTRVPPRFFGFKHSGTILKLNNDREHEWWNTFYFHEFHSYQDGIDRMKEHPN